MLDVDGAGFSDSVYPNQLDQSLTIYWGNKDYALDSDALIKVGRTNQFLSNGDLNKDGLLNF